VQAETLRGVSSYVVVNSQHSTSIMRKTGTSESAQVRGYRRP
jgi:hypothetical protein